MGKVSFGSSKRIDFVKKDGVPPSTYYNVTTKLMSESNGIKFKNGRKVINMLKYRNVNRMKLFQLTKIRVQALITQNLPINTKQLNTPSVKDTKQLPKT